MFGFLDAKTLLRCLNSKESRISLLRRITLRIPAIQDSNAIIRYHNSTPSFCSIDPGCKLQPDRWTSILAGDPRGTSNTAGDSESLSLWGHKIYFLVGDPDGAAVYVDQSTVVPALAYDDIIWCLESGYLDYDKVDAQLRKFKSHQILRLLAAVAMIYEPLADATISVACLQHEFLKSHFAQHLESLLRVQLMSQGSNRRFDPLKDPYDTSKLDRAAALALVVYFESGNDVAAAGLVGVIAISAGDALFVPKHVSIKHPRILIRTDLVCSLVD
jgi:hypothetical protein